MAPKAITTEAQMPGLPKLSHSRQRHFLVESIFPLKKKFAVRACISVSREGWFSQTAQRREEVPVASACVPWSWSHGWHWGRLPKPKKWEDVGTVCSPRADGVEDWAPLWRYWASLKVASWTSPWEGIKAFRGMCQVLWDWVTLSVWIGKSQIQLS